MIQPLHDYLYLKLKKPEKKTEAGIILPDTGQDAPHQGEVLAVGADVEAVEVGDQVIFKVWGAHEVKVTGREAVLIREADILGIVDGTTDRVRSLARTKKIP